MVNQRQATVGTIMSVLAERGVEYKLNGETSVSEVLTRADKEKVKEILVSGFKSGKIECSADFKAKLGDATYLSNYVSGLINNWIRKAPEFNSGSKYEAKNPGSRTGSQDEQVKEMRKLLSVTTDTRAKAIIEEAISARLAEIKPKNETHIDVSKLPAELREALGF